MRCCDDITEVKQRLLGHGKVYKIWPESVNLPCKGNLIYWVKRKLLKLTRYRVEVGVGHLPVVIGLNEDGVGVLCI